MTIDPKETERITDNLQWGHRRVTDGELEDAVAHLRALQARVTDLELSLELEIAAHEFTASVARGFAGRVEAIHGALEWVYRNSEFVRWEHKLVFLYKGWREVEDGTESFSKAWLNEAPVGPSIADAFIALEKESTGG